MGHKQFYRFIFAFFVSLNILVYLMKSGEHSTNYTAAALLTFAASYLFALFAFRNFGWRKKEE